MKAEVGVELGSREAPPVERYTGTCHSICRVIPEITSIVIGYVASVLLKAKIRDEVIRNRCGITDTVEKVQEARLRWFGHVLRREDEEPCRMAWNLSVEGDRDRGRRCQRWSDNIKKDLEEKGLAEGDVDRVRWRSATKAADPRTVWD
ncbi:uncharacterized protein LOC125040382 [Penaeus chinensis]|uniref:uncharacterized protein LOC125040382 n=1 Tax=Penaeus chinensis TaxID=139456 RepID=UPI001FB5AF93|nr:uncharacterized protein LOC125040382 [Penaeus chinensis]